MVDKNESQSLNEISRQKIERARKLQFGRKNGQLKLTTVHSFKGWEWSHIIFLARFGDKTGSRDEIMYTAFTRAQQSLTVVNCMPEYREFGKLLASEGLLTSA
jgi:superfamily I DNA/RNA helicase